MQLIKIILEIGKDATFNLEVHDPPDPLLHLWDVSFRVLQGQNLLELSIEAAQAGHTMPRFLSSTPPRLSSSPTAA